MCIRDRSTGGLRVPLKGRPLPTWRVSMTREGANRIQRQSSRTRWCEVAVNIDHQVGVVAGKGGDLPARARGHNGRIGHDRSRRVIERGDRVLRLLILRPHLQITQRIPQCWVRYGGEIERVGLRVDAGGYAGARQHREIALYQARQVRRTQARGKGGVARVGHTAGRQRIEGQRGARYRREVAVDVEDYVGRVGDVYANRALITGGHDGGGGLDAAVERVHGGDNGLGLPGWVHGEVTQRSSWNHRNVQRIGSGGGRNVAAALLRNGEAFRGAARNRAAAAGRSRVH